MQKRQLRKYEQRKGNKQKKKKIEGRKIKKQRQDFKNKLKLQKTS